MRTPRDFANPQRPERTKKLVHDWRAYMTEELWRVWSSMNDQQKAAVAAALQDIADSEHWE